ncbi:hypothetical protein JCM16303_005271 [Sporobolomyces ruberrimus]
MSTPTPTPLTKVDTSFLTSPNFTSESDWLNATLSSSPSSLSSIESTLSQTLHSLELSLNDTSTLVDRSISDISSSVPRLTFDLQLMRENALLLRFTLDAIRKRGTGFGKESLVGQVIERIRVLDLVKTRMEAARDVLREAESWSTLESEVTGLVDEGQYLKAAERLGEAARSMVVFQNTAEYEARRALMISLQNELEASLSSGLVKAIQERDVKGCKVFWNIFGMIQREQEYTSYYFGSRRSGLVEAWTGAKLLDCVDEPPSNTTNPSNSLLGSNRPPPRASSSTIVTSARLSSPDPLQFSQFLSHFYSELHQLLTEERTYLPAIFPNPSPTLSLFIQTTLEGLSPSFPQRLHSISTSHGQGGFLPELIKCFKATEEFSVQVERIFSKLEPTPAPPTLSTTITPPPPPPVDGTGGTPSSRSNSFSASSSPSPNNVSGTPSSKRKLSKRRSLSKRLSSRSISYALGSSPNLGSEHHNPSSEEAFSSALIGEDSDEDEDDSRKVGQVVRAWETALFEPFLDYQAEYPELEKRFLEYEIEKNLISSSGKMGGKEGDWTDPIVHHQIGSSTTSRGGGSSSEVGPKLLLEKVTRLFGFFEEAVGRNLALTHGYGAKGLVGVLDEELTRFVEGRKEELGRVSRERNEVKSRRKLRRGGGAQGGGDGRDELGGLYDDNEDGGGGLPQGEEMVLEGLEYSSTDWETFQFGLRLLDSCRSINERLGTFEGKLRNRMVMLRHAVKEARENPGTYTVPGTTRGEILLLRQSTLNSVELGQMLDGLEGGPKGGGVGRFLLPRGKMATIEFTRTTQLFLHETILAPLLSHLSDYASLPCWTSSTDRPGGKGSFDLAIPTFSLSPTETISRVGEGLFNLPRLFEVYAQDDALAYSIETLPFVDLEALRSLQHPEPPPMLRQSSSNGPGVAGGHRPTLSEANSSSSRIPHRSSISQHHPPPPPPPVPVIPLSAETVIATWLSSLTLSILSHLTLSVLPSLTRLSKNGSAQLVSDLDYISNVARALDVESPDELESWREAVAMDEKTLREGGGETGTRIDKGVLERVAKIRGFRRGSV